MKAIADCVESIIGAFFEEFGEQATVVLLQRMNIIPVTQFPLQSFMEASSESAEGVPLRECEGTEGDATDEPKSQLSLERLERRLGYTMQGTVPAVGRTGRLSLLDEALTHATFCTSTPLPCYQRLEFLGDAALDLLLMTHHYVRDRSVSPGYLSEMRSVAVNNERLAQVAVELGCAHQLRHGSQTLHRDVTQYTKVCCLGCLQTADASPTPANLFP